MEKLNFKLFSVKDISEMIRRDKVTSNFGWRVHPITRHKQFHNGIDIAIPEGTSLRAVRDCRIEWNFHYQGGLQIIQYFQINKMKVRVGYAHCSWVEKDKKFVKKGEIIARSGNTGLSTGAHLHLTVAVWERDGWIFIDPLTNLIWENENVV